MPSTPTLEDLEAQLATQDAELDELAGVAEAIPPGVTMDSSALGSFDDLAELPATEHKIPCIYGIRA